MEIKMFRLRLHNRGQSVFEYAIILGIVGLALAAMQLYLRRGIQCGIAISADELALQQDSIERDFTKAIASESSTRTTSVATNRTRRGDAARGVRGGIYDIEMDGTTTASYPQPNESWSNWEER